MEARQYLRDLMQSFVDSFEAAGGPDPQAARHRLTGAARALVWAGQLDAGEVHGVLAEFDDLLAERGLRHVVSHRSEARASLGVARSDEAEEAASHSTRTPGELRSVVPINERFSEFDGYLVTAVSLELWSDHLSFRYAMQGDMRRLVRPEGTWPELTWEANDDLGTVYEPIGSTAGIGGPGSLTGSVNFGGAVPAGARRVAVRLHHRDEGPASVLIDLPADESG